MGKLELRGCILLVTVLAGPIEVVVICWVVVKVDAGAVLVIVDAGKIVVYVAVLVPPMFKSARLIFLNFAIAKHCFLIDILTVSFMR